MLARKALAGILLCTVLPFSALAAATPVAKCFRVYSALLYTNVSVSAQALMDPVTVYDAFRWWGPNDPRDQLPKSQGLEKWILVEKPLRQMLIVDLEDWPVQGDRTEVNATVARLSALTTRLRTGGFTQPIGIYGLPPIIDYWRAVQPSNSQQFMAWQAANDVVAPLVDSVDALFPSLYTFYDDQNGWETYARANVAEARRFAKGKPVYAFISMTYHNSSPTLGGQLIPQDYWQRQLRVLSQVADGVVIWGGYTLNWDEEAGWWLATKDFLQTNLRVCKKQPDSPTNLTVK
jgi:hypothetical protein